MPYELRGKCVFNKKTGKKMGCSKTIAKAKAHMKALYAATQDENEETFDKYVTAVLEAAYTGYKKRKKTV